MLATSAEAAIEWPLEYTGESTNRFVHDDRVAPLVESTIPSELSEDLQNGLGGPPDPVYVDDGRYFSASACVYRVCTIKSFFWLDTATGDALGAVLRRTLDSDSIALGSMSFSAEEIPAEATAALLRWLVEQESRPIRVEFYDAENQVTQLVASDYEPRVGYEPDADGPSFDCNRASTEIENALCANAELARLDLDLAQQYDKIRRGHSRLPNRQQLLELQRAWLRERNDECTESADIVRCLRESYQRQRDRLRNWVPE